MAGHALWFQNVAGNTFGMTVDLMQRKKTTAYMQVWG